MSDTRELIEKLNDEDVNIRLNSLKELMDKINTGELERPKKGDDINNHIHTTFSFSPYSPAKALWCAYNAGLNTAGIVDHDSISGAREFISAGKIIGMPTTIGIECRVDMSKTPLNGRRINNTDQNSVAYIVLHGVPHQMIDYVTEFFKPYIEKRNIRNKKMIGNINTQLEAFGIKLDYSKDIEPISEYKNGGSITERHISLALAKKLVERYGRGSGMVSFLKDEMKLHMDKKIESNLLDTNNKFYEYDLLGYIKSDFITTFYIDATEECPDVREVIDFSKKVGAISAYAYLGDVEDSVTGDKRSQKFEDAYIDELFQVIHELGFNAVTYMPPRNTPRQLERVKALCDSYGFFQISGVDINSPRQAFVCEEMKRPEFNNLKDATWALIGHELAATKNLSDSMFSPETIKKYPTLSDRIEAFKRIGLESYK